MKSVTAVMEKIRTVMNTIKFGTLSTFDQSGGIHSNVVAFSINSAMNELYFITAKSTRKYENIRKNKRVAFLAHNCTNHMSDITGAQAIAVKGEAREVTRQTLHPIKDSFLKKHPYMRELSLSPDAEFLVIEIDSFDLVSHFQDVQTIQVLKK